MRKLRSKVSPGVVLGTIALIVALTGTSIALPGTNSVDSGDIKKNAVKSPDIAPNAAKGADIAESTLGQVPSAANANSANSANTANSATTATTAINANAVDGVSEEALTVGRSMFVENCNVDTTARTLCGSVTLNLPRSGRVLVVASGNWGAFGTGTAPVDGECDITRVAGTTPSALVGNELAGTDMEVGELTDTTAPDAGPMGSQSATTVTAPLAAGNHTFGYVCAEEDSDIDWNNVGLSVVMIGSS